MKRDKPEKASVTLWPAVTSRSRTICRLAPLAVMRKQTTSVGTFSMWSETCSTGGAFGPAELPSHPDRGKSDSASKGTIV